MAKKLYIRTEVENIFRVKMYAPKGFCLSPFFYSIYNHKAWSASKRIKMNEDLIYYIFEFKDIDINEQDNMRKFCRESMIKDIIPIKMYDKIKKRWKYNLSRRIDF